LEGEPERGEPVCVQVTELPERALRVVEHHLHAVCCPRCGHTTRAQAPAGVAGHAFGPGLSALVALLAGQCHLSRRLIQCVLAQLGGAAAPSLGSVEALLQESRHALTGPHRQIRQEIACSAWAGVDESTWRVKGKRAWAWLATTPEATLFQISRSRGRKNLPHLLGRSYAGGITSDRWSAYRRYEPERRQLCWAHLARNFTALSESREEETARLGRAGVAICRRLFHHWHDFQAGALSREMLLQRLGPARRRMERLTTELLGAEDGRARGLGQDFARHAAALWNFAEREGVEPTNNAAERALRKLVLWRKTSFGSDTPGGVRLVERILSVVETCRQQHRSAFNYLRDAILAHRCDSPPPLLFG
jgi:transposase